MSNAIASKGVSLASIFDPYVAGTTKARASGIDDAGADTSNLYANIIYGSAAAATGIASEGADLNALYAAKGSANYTLPVNGQSYSVGATSSGVVPIKPALATLNIQFGGGQYNIEKRAINNGGAAQITNNLFAIPSGMAYFRISLSGVSTGVGGTASNSATGWTAIPDSLATFAYLKEANQVNNATQTTSASVKLDLADASQNQIYTGTFAGSASTDISA